MLNPALGAVRPAPERRIERLNPTLGELRLPPALKLAFSVVPPSPGGIASGGGIPPPYSQGGIQGRQGTVRPMQDASVSVGRVIKRRQRQTARLMAGGTATNDDRIINRWVTRNQKEVAMNLESPAPTGRLEQFME